MNSLLCNPCPEISTVETDFQMSSKSHQSNSIFISKSNNCLFYHLNLLGRRNTLYFNCKLQLPPFFVSESSDIINLVCVCCLSLEAKLGQSRLEIIQTNCVNLFLLTSIFNQTKNISGFSVHFC